MLHQSIRIPILLSLVVTIQLCSGSGNISTSKVNAIEDALINADQNTDILREYANDGLRDSSCFTFKALISTKFRIELLGFDYGKESISSLAKRAKADKVFDQTKSTMLIEPSTVIRLECGKDKEILFTGATDQNGIFETNLVLPASFQKRCNLTIHKKGFQLREINNIDIVKFESVNRGIALVSTLESTNTDFIDSDGDLIPNIYDAFPFDSERVFRNTIPSDSFLTIAFEDNFPKLGDGDYNDFIARYQISELRNNENKITDLLGFSESIAKLAGYNHRFGLKINFPRQTASLNVVNTDFNSNRNNIIEDLLINDEANLTLFESTKNAIKVRVDFKDDNGYPRALLVPSDWRQPLERKYIEAAYPKFTNWRETLGSEDQDWIKLG